MAQSSAASAHFAECPTPLKAAWKTRQAAEAAPVVDHGPGHRASYAVQRLPVSLSPLHLSWAADGSRRGRRPPRATVLMEAQP
jgi:hypothetical protein